MKNVQRSEEPVAGAVGAEFYGEGFSAALARQWQGAPWYVGSGFIHLVIFALFLLFTPEPKPVGEKFVLNNEGLVPADDLAADPLTPDKVEIPLPDDQLPKNDPIATTIGKIDLPQPAPAPVIEEPGDPEPTGEGTEVAEGAGGDDPVLGMYLPSGMSRHVDAAARGMVFQRQDAKTKAQRLRRFGASKESQQTLLDGLRWLAAQQEPDGRWNCAKYEGGNSDISVTALAQLAFLGAGSTTGSGEFRRNVRLAQHYLLSRRDEKTGRIGSYRYEAAITMMALAESLAMTNDKQLLPVVRGQVEDAVRYQSRRSGGWGYAPEDDDVRAHVDTSVTGWWMMGMKSALLAGIPVDRRCIEAARGYFRSVAVADKSGVVTTRYVAQQGATANMTAVGLACLQFLGTERKDPLVRGQAEAFQKQYAGSLINPKGGANYYGWYYQALGFSQLGPQSAQWKRFNPVMQKVLMGLQEKTGRYRGSWPVTAPEQSKPGHFELSVGRVGVTAMACLILEVYYRFETAHESGA